MAITHAAGNRNARKTSLPISRAAWAVAGLAVAGAAAALTFFILNLLGGFSARLPSEIARALYLAGPIISGPLGALIVSRQPRNRAGWAILVIALSQAFSGLPEEYGHYAFTVGGLPGEVSFGWLANWTWVPNGMGIVLFLLLFPDGRLPAKGWRVVVGLIGLLEALLLFLSATGPFLACCPSHQNPVGWTNPIETKLFSAIAPHLGALNVIFGICAIGIIHRYVRSGPEQRTQVKWLIYAILVLLVAQVLGHKGPWGTPGPWGDAFSELAFYAMPAAVAIAIFRYHLYEIDRIINRTAVYAVVTAALAGAYLGIVLLLQAVVPVDQNSPVVVAMSTLAVAAAFRPLRNRVQTFIDRRFNRARFDAQKTLEAFSAHLRDGVALTRLEEQLLGVVDETMRPAALALWLRPDPGGRP